MGALPADRVLVGAAVPVPFTRIATRLHLSPSTLKRRLRDDGIRSYRELLDTTRHGLAMRYLANRAVTTLDVAFLVGFSSVRAFHRAFKRWTGRSPARFRDEVATTPPQG